MSEQPQWLNAFTEQVCTSLRRMDDAPPIGCHYAFEDQTWEISLFVSPTEIVGGQHDGERLACLFAVDLLDLLQLFDVVESAGWQPHPLDDTDEVGSHVAVEGYVAGRRIWLRILADTPTRYAPGRYMNVLEQKLLDTWES